MNQMNANEEQKTNISNIKRNLTLDLNQKKNLMLPLTGNILSSPDLNMLKVGTPELEKMILAEGMANTPTPSLMFASHSVTAEQASFAGGFEEALSNLHNSNSQQESDSNSSTMFNDSFPPFAQVKEEPQTVPNINQSPPMSPVDMEYQERMKLERKRQRNRLAASKCRSRKLERISKLEEKVKILKSENMELGSILNQLKETVGLLKLEVLEHNQAGCTVINY